VIEDVFNASKGIVLISYHICHYLWSNTTSGELLVSFVWQTSRCIHVLKKKFISHAPSPPWTANKGGNRAVGLSPWEMYQGYMRYIE